MARPYEGYPSWNSWNVSLWINNDYDLYCVAYDMVQKYGMPSAIAILSANWTGKRTPDGGVFTKRAISLALEGMDE
mgnify:FL=1|tara:strand:+ start:37113 stop:37340 length:228 start_codon:yes stop_codon:yes gene_type:complete